MTVTVSTLTQRARLEPQVWAAPVASFAAFGALVGWRIGDSSLVAAGLGAVLGALFALLGTYLLVLVLVLANPRLGRDVVGEATATGLLLLLPFAVLALAAELALGWNASQTFSSAGLMTACGAVGVEVGRRGGAGLRSVLVPTVIAFLLSTAWVSLSALAGTIWP